MTSVRALPGSFDRPGRERDARLREDRELFERYRRTGDPAVREVIVRRFLPLVRRLVGRYARTGEPFDDLLQAGSLGLLHAIERFDPDRGTAFSSFAVPTILGEIKGHFRDRTWSVKVPRDVQQTIQRLGRAEERLEGALGRSPTTAELADALEIGAEDVLDARQAALTRKTQPLDQPHGDGEPEGRRAIDAYEVEETGFSAAEDAATVARLVPFLDARAREVLRLRFEEDLTQAEIGERIGCSTMHVSRLVRGAIERLAMVHEAQLDSAFRRRSGYAA